VASKSAHQRALYREREAAKAAGTLSQWYEAQAAERQKKAPPPSTNPFANYERISTPEGASWPADETGYSRYMVWRLPVSSGSNRPTPPRN
jgi:hypothetical protein